jgi:hypothetical protein
LYKRFLSTDMSILRIIGVLGVAMEATAQVDIVEVLHAMVEAMAVMEATKPSQIRNNPLLKSLHF